MNIGVKFGILRNRKTRGRSRSARPGNRRFCAGAEVLEGRQLLSVAIGELALPEPNTSRLKDVTTGPDGNIWYTRQRFTSPPVAVIGRVTPDGTVTEFNIPGSGLPDGITAGPDGNLWFVDNAPVLATIDNPVNLAAPSPSAISAIPSSFIGRVTTDGVFTTFPISADVGIAQSITAGPDGNLWFTSTRGINRITTDGVVTRFELPSHGQPQEITAAPDGNLWFTELDAGLVGRISTAGQIDEFPVPRAPEFVGKGITVGPDGNVWFLETSSFGTGPGFVDRVTPAGAVTQFPLPKSGFDLVTGNDGALWITENGDSILRFALDGTTTEYPVPTSPNFSDAITAAPDGSLWFAEVSANRLGRVFLDATSDGSIAVTGSAPLNGTEGTAVFGTIATFTDSHSGIDASEYRARIDWGDGHSTFGNIGPDGAGGFVVNGSHIYSQQGSYTATVTVFDPTIDAPREALATTTISVANSALSPISTDTLVFRGADGSILVGRANAAVGTGTYTATIEWGDGTTSAGTIDKSPFRVIRPLPPVFLDGTSAVVIPPDPSDPVQLIVSGSHTYAADGWYIVRTHIVDETGQETIITSQVQYVSPKIYSSHTVNIDAKAGVPFGDVLVGMFYTTAPNFPAGRFPVMIDWGDGTAPTPGLARSERPGAYEVRGSHRYEKPGNYIFHVTVIGFGAPIDMEGAAHVEDVPISVFGQLDPGSDRGASRDDAVISSSRPSFLGSTVPGATVQLYARQNGDGKAFKIGQAVADRQGHWSLTATNVPDGKYMITAHASTADGRRGSIRVNVGGTTRMLIVDTTAPKVAGVLLDPSKRQVRINFQDAHGMDVRGLSHAGRYALQQITGSGATPIEVSKVSLFNGGRSVILDLGQPIPDGRYVLALNSLNVRDRAGNALDGEFVGSFATGNGQAGGNFVGQFLVSDHRVTVPTPIAPATSSNALAARTFGGTRKHH